MLEQLGLFSKKYLFSSLLIIIGIALVVMAITPSDAIIQKTQSTWFLIGGLSILVSGIVSLLYALEVITKVVHFAVMGALLVTCTILTILSVESLQDTIEKKNRFEKYEAEVKQSLEDIRTIQLAYKKVYGHYAPDFAELKRFLMLDEVYRTVPIILHESGKIPDRQPTPEECAILGYDLIEDDAFIKDGIDEAEAIKLGYFRVDTVWVPVLEDLFLSEEILNSDVKRKFDFDPSKVDVVRNTGETEVKFEMKAVEIDSVTNAFTVFDPFAYNPFKEPKQSRDTLRLGNLSDGSTNGSWEK